MPFSVQLGLLLAVATAFASIVGSGPNATTLHYNADNRVIERGDIVVMDIGASYHGYAADVTRSIPASAILLILLQHTLLCSGLSGAALRLRRAVRLTMIRF